MTKLIANFATFCFGA